MTAQDSGQREPLPRPACTPAAIRSVLSALAGADVLRRFDDDLDAAFERSRLDGDLGPLLEAVRRWWFEADAWRDPAAQREFLARVDGYVADGPPSADRRVTWQEVRARFGV